MNKVKRHTGKGSNHNLRKGKTEFILRCQCGNEWQVKGFQFSFDKRVLFVTQGNLHCEKCQNKGFYNWN